MEEKIHRLIEVKLIYIVKRRFFKSRCQILSVAAAHQPNANVFLFYSKKKYAR
jgi:hypothetical protein